MEHHHCSEIIRLTLTIMFHSFAANYHWYTSGNNLQKLGYNPYNYGYIVLHIYIEYTLIIGTPLPSSHATNYKNVIHIHPINPYGY